MLEKFPVGLKENFAKLILALFVLSILASAVSMAPVANAQGYPPHIPTLSPTTPSSSPSQQPAATASPTPAATQIPWNFPSTQPTKVAKAESGGFWSPLTIGIIVAALVAFAIPAAFFFMRRGKPKTLLEEDHSYSKPQPAPTSRPAAAPRYGQYAYQPSYQGSQPARPTQTPRYGQPTTYGYSRPSSTPSVTTRSAPSSSHSQPAPYTRVCSHCKRTVRNDQNICPYCDKRIK
jgi:hypothetical protein